MNGKPKDIVQPVAVESDKLETMIQLTYIANV